MTYNDVLEKIKSKVANYSHFRIGKTEKDLDDHFQNSYKSQYDKIIKICLSSHSATITNWEKSLIEDFMKDDAYTGKFDNKSNFDGIMPRGKDYHIYVAVKK